MSADGTPSSAEAAAARRNARWLIGGQSASLLGDYVAILALPLFVKHLTGSALDPFGKIPGFKVFNDETNRYVEELCSGIRA